jgi:hypothetical protein
MGHVLSAIASTATQMFSAHPGRVILAVSLMIGCLHFGGYAVRGVRPRIVRGDAVHYYVYTRSLVFDRDLDFENDYKGLYSLDFSVEPPPAGFTFEFGRTPTGLVRNYMAIGTPLTWLPLYLGVSGAVAAWDWAGGRYPLDGFGLVFQIVPAISGLIAGGLGLWFSFLLCKEFASKRSALAGTLCVFAGTSYLYYMLVAPSYSHAVSACVSSGFFLFWWRTRHRTNAWRYVWLGVIGGILALVRWQDGLALSVALFDLVAQGRLLPTWRKRAAFGSSRLALVGLSSLAVFTPQMIAWYVLYGQLFTIPQGSDFMRWSAPAIGPVLVSPFRGLFSWTPIAAAGLLGIPWMWRLSRRLTVTAAFFFLASIYVNAAVVDWWAGEAFGARRFLSCFPMMALGATVLIAGSGGLRRAARVAVAALVCANLLLLLHYELFMLGYRSLAAYPANWSTLWIDRFVTPVKLLASLL